MRLISENVSGILHSIHAEVFLNIIKEFEGWGMSYHDVADGYKMIGNAVPVNFAYHLAMKINADFKK